MISPEIIFLAGEVAKKPDGWTVERWLTTGGFVLSVLLGVVTFLKFMKERRDARSVSDAAMMKAPAEKDVIIVTGAQSAVLMMEQAAKAARDEADRKQVELDRANAKISDLEQKIQTRDDKIDALEDQIRKIQRQLDTAMEELQSLRIVTE